LAGLLIILELSKQVLKQLSNAREVIDKMLVKVAKFKKDLNISIRLRPELFGYSLNISQSYSNTLFVNNKV
jgi:hypothetical protein